MEVTSALNREFVPDHICHPVFTKNFHTLSIAATLYAFATIIGFSTGGFISDPYGKKLTVFVFNLSAFACWIVSATATTKWFLYVSYSLQGFFGAIAYNCVGEMDKF